MHIKRFGVSACAAAVALVTGGCGGGSGGGAFISLPPSTQATTEGGGDPSTPSPPLTARTAEEVCDTVSGNAIGGATLTAAVVAVSGANPKYCKVSGTIEPSTHFEMRFPDSWNGKLHYNGGGGYNGSISALNVPALTKGYVDLGSDSGHQGAPLDASFALDANKAQLFGSTAIPLVMSSALEIVKKAYGTAPQQSYFEGCSQGGREALMTVQRYPNLFDGVIGGAFGGSSTAFLGHFNLNAKALAVPGAAMSAAKTELLAKAVRDACDGLDGIVDGVVSNRAACVSSGFNPASLRCPSGGDTGDTCLSDAQLGFISSWTSDAVFAGGTYRDPGWNLTGHEDSVGAWGASVTGNGNQVITAAFLFQDTTVKNYLARDPNANSLTYVWDSDLASLSAMAALNDATQADIRPFRDHRGKLIMWHGGADPLIGVNGTIKYYGDMTAAVGGQAQADEFTRLYVLPGVLHCGGGPGAGKVDLLTALDQWVTAGSAPGTLTAQSVGSDGTVAFERPACRYPQYPKYTGPANDVAAAKLAANYTCSSS